MLSTRTRSTIVALIASLSFAATTVAPAVSHAQPDWPGLGQAIHCESLAAGREAYRKKAETAENEGHYALAEYYRLEGWRYAGEMVKEHCPMTLSPAVANVITGTTPAKVAAKL
jgi:hypothetical protein